MAKYRSTAIFYRVPINALKLTVYFSLEQFDVLVAQSIQTD